MTPIVHAQSTCACISTVHAVGSQAKALLATKGLEVELCRTPPGQVEHLIGINDVRIAVEAEPSRVAYFFASWELPQFRWEHALIPDAIFTFKHPGRHTFILEYDRGTESREQLSRKFLAYSNGLSGFPFDAVVLVTRTPERLETVRQRLRHRPVLVRLLGTTLSTIKAIGVHTVKFQDICAASERTTFLAELCKPSS